MAHEATEGSLQGYARLAGFMYVFSMAVFIAYFVIVSGFLVKGDFAQTAQNIAANEYLYRIGLVLRVAGGLTLVVLGWGFYALLKPVDANLSLFALLWRLVQTALDTAGAVILFAALDNYLATPNEAGARALASQLMSNAHRASFNVQFIYLSMTSIIVFYLLLKSRFIPRLLAGFGLLSSLLFLVVTLAHMLVPDVSVLGTLVAALETAIGAANDPSARALASQLENVPMFITEVGTGLWLLVFGANLKYWRAKQAEAPSE